MTDLDPRLRAAREQTIDVLCDGFARDALSLPELERRLDRARRARTRAELRALLSDLAPTPPAAVGTGADAAASAAAPPSPAAPRPTPPTRRPAARGSHLAFAVLGGTRRAGRWAPPESMVAVAVMGGVELDFRDAVLEPGVVVDINAFAFWGAVEITVPPDVHVESRGFALLGGFDQTAEPGATPAAAPPPDAPTVRVNGLAIMGGVEVKVRDRDHETDSRKHGS